MEYGVGKMTEGYLTELSRSKRVASVEQLVDDFWDRYYARIKPWYQPESDDVILTASFGLTVGEACRRLGVRNLVASEVDVETMKVTYPQLQHQQDQTVPRTVRSGRRHRRVLHRLQVRSADDRHGPACVHGQGEHHYAGQVGNSRKQHNVTNNERGIHMSMPLDLYVIRHGESEANVIVQAGEQGDNSLYTQDNVTVPDRSWRLTATGRKQADCIGRWLVSQQQLFDRYMVSPYVRTRETAATMALPKAKWEENRVLRERSWGEINTITKDEFKNNYARNWNFKNTDPLYWRPPAGESIADVAEDRVHNILTSLSRKSDSESVVMVTHGDFMLALMLTIEDLADEEFLHRADSDDWKITNCTCLHYTRRDPETGRTSKRVRWEQTARPVLDETTGRWEVKVEPWREFKRPYLSNGDLVDVVQAVDPHLLEYYGK
jgi:broad specificity phosphatase PhoE